MLETEVQKACQDYLTLRGFFHWRHNNTAVYDKRSGTYRKFHGTYGVPDIETILEGFYVGIEVKRPGGKQSDHQKAFEERLSQNGGYYLLIDSVDELASDLELVAADIRTRLVKYHTAQAKPSAAA